MDHLALKFQKLYHFFLCHSVKISVFLMLHFGSDLFLTENSMITAFYNLFHKNQGFAYLRQFCFKMIFHSFRRKYVVFCEDSFETFRGHLCRLHSIVFCFLLFFQLDLYPPIH